MRHRSGVKGRGPLQGGSCIQLDDDQAAGINLRSSGEELAHRLPSPRRLNRPSWPDTPERGPQGQTEHCSVRSRTDRLTLPLTARSVGEGLVGQRATTTGAAGGVALTPKQMPFLLGFVALVRHAEALGNARPEVPPTAGTGASVSAATGAVR